MRVKTIAASAAMIMVATAAVVANQNKFDANIQKAATDIAASQLGTIRGSIDFDEEPVIIKKEHEIKSQLEPSLSPRPAWVPESENDKLPPVTRHVDGLDDVSTGSIGEVRKPKSLPELWDRFDQYGNPVDRYGNRID